jgi:hypothetical protein
MSMYVSYLLMGHQKFSILIFDDLVVSVSVLFLSLLFLLFLFSCQCRKTPYGVKVNNDSVMREKSLLALYYYFALFFIFKFSNQSFVLPSLLLLTCDFYLSLSFFIPLFIILLFLPICLAFEQRATRYFDEVCLQGIYKFPPYSLHLSHLSPREWRENHQLVEVS